MATPLHFVSLRRWSYCVHWNKGWLNFVGVDMIHEMYLQVLLVAEVVAVVAA